MKVVVMGAGVVGITTAYYLAREGAEVVVVDRAREVASAASASNAGLISVGHVLPWSNPRAPGQLLRSLVRPGSGPAGRIRLDPGLWEWGLRFLWNCPESRMRRNALKKLRLAQYSQAQMHELVDAEGIEYGAQRSGVLYLYRRSEALEAGARDMAFMRDAGQTLEVVDAERCLRLEPSLSASIGDFVGAIHGPTDESGDSQAFATQLADSCVRMGARLMLGVTVLGMTSSGRTVTAVTTDSGPIAADRFVLALGSQAPAVARSVGERLPVYPVKGYSLTADITDPSRAPTLAGIDEGRHVAWARYGDRLRFTGGAEFVGHDSTVPARAVEPIRTAAEAIFPRAANWTEADVGIGFRPMTPSGPPILGPRRHGNLFLNVGHGQHGWTLSCGSARIVADLVLGRTPALAVDRVSA